MSNLLYLRTDEEVNGVKFFTVIALVLAVTGLLLGTGCSSNTKFISTTTGSVTPNIEFTTVLGSTANPIAPILLIADSFIIVPNTSENEAEWEGQNITDFTQLTLPYVSYGHYISKPFFVNNGETLQVIMNSAVPASDMANNGGLDTELMLAESGQRVSVRLVFQFNENTGWFYNKNSIFY